MEVGVALPEFTRKLVEGKLEAFYARKVPSQIRGEIQWLWTFRGHNVTLFESRPYFAKPDVWSKMPLAQFRFDLLRKTWTLYVADRNGRWSEYPGPTPTADFDELLNVVENDALGIIWG
jgi:hypothetical protein